MTNAEKEAFKKRMAAGRKKAAKQRGAANPKKRKPAAKKKRAAKKATKKKANPNARKSKKAIAKGFGRQLAAEHVREKKRAAKTRKHKHRAIRKRPNSSMEEMFETFHQKPAGHILTYDEQVRYADKFAEMGRLMELRCFLNDANPDFAITRFGETKAVCTADGKNIYFIGGDQAIDLKALDIGGDKDMVELGPCTYIAYFTTKGFHDFEPTKYYHQFGEENGILPVLAYDRLNRSLFLIGGDYRVERPGIIN